MENLRGELERYEILLLSMHGYIFQFERKNQEVM